MNDNRYPMPKNLDDEYLELFNQLTEEHKQRVLTAAFDIMDWRAKNECGKACDEATFGTHGKFEEEDEQCQSCLRNAIGNAAFRILQLHPEWEEMPEFWWRTDYTTIENNVQDVEWAIKNATDKAGYDVEIKLTQEEIDYGRKILKENEKYVAWMRKWLGEKNDIAKSMNIHRKEGFYHITKVLELPNGRRRVLSKKCHERRWVTFDALLRKLNEKIKREQISL